MPNRLVRAIRVAIFAASLTAVAAPVTEAQVTTAAPAVVKHTVKTGDTLWDIAKFYLKDPFRWPEVFHANTDIVKNPHWIYPGQVLAIDGSAVKPDVAARTNADGFVVAQIQTRAQAPTVFAEASGPARVEAMASTALPPALTVRPGEYEAAPYAVEADADKTAGRLIGAVDEPALGLTSDAGFRLFDRVYLSSPAGRTLSVGETVLVARTDKTITDVGRVIEPTGVIRVDSVASGKRLVGVIVKQFGSIKPNQGIVSLGQSFEPTTVRPIGGTFPTTAKLLWIQGSPRLPSVQSYVILAASHASDVRPGDQFTLFAEPTFDDGTRAPLSATATVTVVRVTPLGISGLVVHQTQPEIRVGMPSRLTARMP
jgi:LysM repeat protein